MGLFQRVFTRMVKKALNSPVEDRGGWTSIVRESFAGAWQQNVTVDYNTILSYHAVFACISLISSDIAKLRIKLVEQRNEGIWIETTNPAYSPVLRKPNTFQNRIQFWENWIISKLTRGNTYVLKQRDGRNVVIRLYVLDPARVRPLISDDGAVFYELNADNISGIKQQIVVPAREIIHDRFNCLFHPLVGVSPIYAAGLAATQGLNIQTGSASFFANRSEPGGVLTAPGHITDETAARLKATWQAGYEGTNRGKIAVLGDGLKFEPMAITAEDSQLIEQLKWSAEIVCSVFHVPPYKIGVGTTPSYNNIQALNLEYYSQCLQRLIEDAELCLDEGLEIIVNTGTEFDLDGLLRMDTVTQVAAIRDSIGAGFMAPNEGRKKMDMLPVEGGDSPYLQQQNFSLAALAKRDAQADPFATAQPEPPSNPPSDDDDSDDDEPALDAAQFEALLTKGAEAHAIG